MLRPALYFPYIHVRDDQWLKTAALYWPSIRRLVPFGYITRDSRTAEVFADAEILRDEVPGGLVDAMAWDLLRTLKQNTKFLVKDYGIERADADWDGRPWGVSSGPGHPAQLGWIHVTKFPPSVLRYLVKVGLAYHGRAEVDDPWIGLHPTLAGAYMTALAGRVSEEESFEPLTDQVDLRVATPSSEVKAAINLLLGRANADHEAESAIGDSGVENYIMLALKYVRPKNLEDVSAAKIVQCRENLQEELQNFRNFVESQRNELAELAGIPSERRKLESFNEHVEQTIEIPLQKLEKGLQLHKLEPTRSLLMAGSVAPPLGIGAALNTGHIPTLAMTGVGTLTAIGTAWWQIHTVRANARASSPVGYLLDVRDHLTPVTLTARVGNLFRGTYGSK